VVTSTELATELEAGVVVAVVVVSDLKLSLKSTFSLTNVDVLSTEDVVTSASVVAAALVSSLVLTTTVAVVVAIVVVVVETESSKMPSFSLTDFVFSVAGIRSRFETVVTSPVEPDESESGLESSVSYSGIEIDESLASEDISLFPFEVSYSGNLSSDGDSV